jgi:hypothetical protein
MSTIAADSGLLYDALATPRQNRVAIIALLGSVIAHAAAIALLPGLRTPLPPANSITVELQPAPKKQIEDPKPQLKRAPPKADTPFVRQEVAAVAAPAPMPEPVLVDPRNDVAVAPRPEPLIERRPTTEPPPVRLEPRLQRNIKPPPEPHFERPQQVAEAAPRPEPVLERQPEVKPEPRFEARAEPQVQPMEPKIAAKLEQRVEPVAAPREEPTLLPTARRHDSAAACTHGCAEGPSTGCTHHGRTRGASVGCEDGQ